MNDLVGDQAKKYSLVESKIISSVNSYGLNELQAISYEAMKIFKNDKIDINKLGYYLNKSWNIKRIRIVISQSN